MKPWLRRFVGYEALASDTARVKQIGVLVRNTPVVAGGSAIGAVILAIVLWPVSSKALIVGWTAIVVALSLWRFIVWYGNRDRPEPTSVRPRTFARATFSTMFSGMVWGAGACVLFPADSPLHQAFLTFVVGGMAASAVASLSAVPSVCLGFILSAMVPLIARFALHGTSDAMLAGALLAIYVLALLQFVRSSFANFREGALAEASALRNSRALFDLANDPVLTSGNLREAFQKITEAAAEMLDIDRASIWRYDKSRSKIVCQDLYVPALGEHRKGFELFEKDYPAFFAALERDRTIVSDDPHADPRTREFSKPYLKRLGVTAMLEVPIRVGGEVVGVACHEQVGRKRPWTAEDANFVGSIGDLISLAFQSNERQIAETRAQRSRNALQRSERLFRAIFERAGLGIAQQALDGSYIRVNSRFAEFLGHSPKQLAKMRYQDVADRGDAKAIAPKLSQMIAGDIDFVSSEQRYLRADDTVVWGKSTVSLVETAAGKPRSLVVVVEDITERRRAEEISRQALIFRNMSEAVILIDASNGIVIDCNPAAAELWGYAKDEIEGRPVVSFFDSDALAELPAWLRSVVEGEAIDPMVSRWSGEARIIGRGGAERLCELDALPVEGDAGQPELIVVIIRDITDRKEAERAHELLQQQFHEAQKHESLGTLAGGVAHDFNNILSIVSGYTHLVGQDIPDASPHRQMLDEILHATNRGANLVHQILAYARRETETAGAVNLDQVMSESVSMLRATLPATLNIEIQVEKTVAPIFADETQIHQVVTNLCINAAHAIGNAPGTLSIDCRAEKIDSRGSVNVRPLLAAKSAETISIEKRPDGNGGKLWFGSLVAGDHVRLTIKDDGCGIDGPTLERVLEPFFTTKEVGQGTGLGLAAVTGIMRSCRSAFAMDSKLGRGTRFDLYFPAADDTAAKIDDHETEQPSETMLLLEGSNKARRKANAG